MPTADPSSTNAEQQLMWNPDNAVCPGQCFRPVGLAFDGPSQRLFMTSDSTGELFLVTGANANLYNIPPLVHQNG
jgi:hypothetical protein